MVARRQRLSQLLAGRDGRFSHLCRLDGPFISGNVALTGSSRCTLAADRASTA